MNHIARFFQSIPQTFVPSAYRNDFAERSLGAAIGYVLVLSILAVAIGILPFARQALTLRPLLRPMIEKTKSILPALYPENLVITVENGALQTNAREPVTIDFPAEALQMLPVAFPSPSPHMIVIDMKAHAEDFPKMDTVVLVTQTAIVFPSDEMKFDIIPGKNGQADFQWREGYHYSVFPIPNDPGKITIDRAAYDRGLTAIFPFLERAPSLLQKFVVATLLLAPLLLGPFLALWKLFLLLPGSLVLKLSAMILHVPLRYERIYVIGAFALTPTIVYELLERLGGFHYRFVGLLLFFGFGLAALWQWHGEKGGKAA